MDPERVLQLIISAPERYETVRAALRYRGDGATIKTVREQFLRSGVGRRTFGDPPETIQQTEPDGPFGWHCKIWRVDDNRWRQELELPNGGVDIRASTGRMSSGVTPERPPGASEQWDRRLGGPKPEEDPAWVWLATETYWTMYPFDPEGIATLTSTLEKLDLRVEGPSLQANREALRLVGVPGQQWEYPPEPLWWGADEYEVLVDAERGILLRCASRLGGQEFDVLEVEEVFFDESFPDKVFELHGPLSWP